VPKAFGRIPGRGVLSSERELAETLLATRTLGVVLDLSDLARRLPLVQRGQAHDELEPFLLQISRLAASA